MIKLFVGNFLKSGTFDIDVLHIARVLFPRKVDENVGPSGGSGALAADVDMGASGTRRQRQREAERGREGERGRGEGSLNDNGIESGIEESGAEDEAIGGIQETASEADVKSKAASRKEGKEPNEGSVYELWEEARVRERERRVERMLLEKSQVQRGHWIRVERPLPP